MAPRTITSHHASISMAITGSLTFAQPPSPASKTSLFLPPGSKFDSQLHWHESYTEFFRVTSGVMRVILEDASGTLQTFYIGPGSGIVEIPSSHRHRLRRGDSGGEFEPWMLDMEFKEGGKIPREVWMSEVRGEEWTDPQDGRKEMFFRNLAGVVNEDRSGVLGEVVVGLGVGVIMRGFDNWPAFFGGRIRGVEWWFSHMMLAVAGVAGWCLGLRGVYEEYTPVELRVVTGVGGGKGKKDL